MSDGNICSDLSARCGGDVNIGAWGDEGAVLALKDLLSYNGEGFSVNVKEGDSSCPVQVFVNGGEDGFAKFCALTEGKPRAALGNGEPFITAERCPVVPAGDGDALLRTLLFEFHLKRIDVDIPGWTQVMPQENSAIAELLSEITEKSTAITKMSGLSALDTLFTNAKYWKAGARVDADLKTGYVKITAEAKDGIFFEMLSEIAGDGIDDEYSLMRFVRSAAEAKKGYSKVKDALECASVNGYGIVQPSEDDIVYEKPAVVRQGGNVGIKLKASAPSYHIIRVDVSGEVSPVMGSAAQSENMVSGMMGGFERNPEEMWNTDLFGKTLKSMVQEALSSKVSAIQEEARAKLRRAINRMVNEGKGGAIVIIL